MVFMMCLVMFGMKRLFALAMVSGSCIVFASDI